MTDTANEVVTYKATDTTDSVTLTNTASVQFGAALPVSATKSTIAASPTAPVTGPNGTEVTVTLLAADGTSPIVGKVVTLGVTGAASIVGGSTGTSNASGQVLFQVTDNTPETVTVSAVDTTDSVTLQATPSVTFSTPPPPTVSPSLSTATVSGSPAPADGSTEAVVGLTILDTTGKPISGIVTTVTSPSATTTVDPVLAGTGTAPGTTDAQGQTNWSVRDTKAETVTLTVSAGGVPLTTSPTAVFTAGTPDANASTVTANPANVPADGSTASTVTVTLTDYFGNPVQGKAITLTPSGGNSKVAATAAGTGSTPGTTNAQGVATFAVTDATTEVVTYTASDPADALTLAALATVTFGNAATVVPVQGDSTATVNASQVVADGKTPALITLTLRDGMDCP